LQRTYGKSPEDLKTLVEGFNWGLQGHKFEEVEQAFHEYVKTSPNVPTISEILEIIRLQNRRKRIPAL
jgi:hypothetical protein